MGIKRFNPGIVNTEHVKKTSYGVTEKPCKDGGTHVSAYNKEGRRISWNVTPEGKIKDMHSSDANKNHIDYKGGY